MADSYQYQRLDTNRNEIRLLHVAAGKGDDELHCKLQVVSLDAVPEYETISYCWGDATERSTLLLDGAIFNAPKSSCAVLQLLRSPLHNRIFWIDAICINQDDLDERSSQVLIMDRVYRSGKENIAYLGNAENDEIAENAQLAYKRAKIKVQEVLDSLSDEQRQYVSHKISGNTYISREDVDSLQPLFACPWFSRIWIVQESVLSKYTTCHWHNTRFSLDSLLLIADFIAASGIDAHECFFSTSSMYNFRQRRILGDSKEHADFSLRLFFTMASTKGASEPRDHVFAWLSMLGNERIHKLPGLLAPDYRKSVSSVFQDATKFALFEEGDLIFSYVNHKSESELHDTQMASWSLRWNEDSVSEGSPYLFNLGDGHPGGQNFFSPLNLNTLQQIDGNGLSISTFCLDEVVWSSRSIWDSTTTPKLWKRDYNDIQEVFLAVRLAIQRRAAMLEMGELVDYIIADILTGGLVTERPRVERYFKDDDHIIECYRACWRYYCVHGRLPGDTADLPETAFYGTFIERARGRQFFTLSAGLVGIGPMLTQPHDVVAVFQHGRSPHILRRHGKGYKYVGAAYIPGVMKGEVLKMDVEPEMIDIF